MRILLTTALLALPAAALAGDPGLISRVDEVPDGEGGVWRIVITPNPKIGYVPPKQAVVIPQTEAIVPAAPKKPVIETPKPSEPAAFSVDDTAPAVAEVSMQDNAADEKPDPEPIAPESEGTIEAAPLAIGAEPYYTTGYPAINPYNYAHIYAAIPFIRSEYNANPSYRHETTMEILFGRMRPTVIHKNRTTASASPVRVRRIPSYGAIQPYSYTRFSPYRYGRGLFSYPGAYARSYNFYYPFPTVYRNY